jgi:hypothetical protein
MQKSLFSLPQKQAPKQEQVKETKAPEQTQKSLFNLPTQPTIPTTGKRRSPIVPDVGETVIILSLNDGVEGVVDFVDHDNLYKDYLYPIQLTVPSLGDMMYRAPLSRIKRKAT